MNKQYKESAALNQSLLKLILEDPIKFQNARKYIQEDDEVSYDSGVGLGSLVDCLALTEDRFNDEYIISNIAIPTGQMKDFVEKYAKHWINGAVEEASRKAYEEVGFKRDKFETVTERFLKEGNDYFNFLLNSQGKKVIIQDDYDKAMTCRQALYNKSSVFQLLYGKEHLFDDVELFYQKDLYAKLFDIHCKALIDVLRINHTTKTIQEIDLKTTIGSPYSRFINGYGWAGFLRDALGKYRYDYQRAFYKSIIKANYPGYSIESYIVSVSTTYYNTAIYNMYKFTEEAKKDVVKSLEYYKWYEANGYDNHPDEVDGILNY